MASPENQTTKAIVDVKPDTNTKSSSSKTLDQPMISSSVPNARSVSFITDSSDKSDDNSSLMTYSNSYFVDEVGEEGANDADIEHDRARKPKFSIPQPIIYTSSLSSDSEHSISASPTSVYATMLSANNIVNNSMSVLQVGTRLPNPPTLIEYEGIKFLIMDAPSQSNIHLYLKEMERANVKDIVRICEPTYPREIVESAGIKVHDWVFPDGESPPSNIIEAWLTLVDAQKAAQDNSSIAVHCVAGLGRAPVLVAIALIENGMGALDAVMFIRKRRRGAINNKQLKFLENYKPRHLQKNRCIIM
jgi:protein tyrosine phosphatase type IVA